MAPILQPETCVPSRGTHGPAAAGVEVSVSWKRQPIRSGPRPGPSAPGRGERGRTRAALEARGVAEDLARTLAERLEPKLRGLSSEASEALLDGAAAAYAVECVSQESLQRQLDGLREIERLMGGFAGELAKLDEALEVLAAHVRRMRAQTAPAPEPEPTLH